MHALVIGIAIWAVFLGCCAAYQVRRRRRMREHPPALTAQQVWDEASPEAKQEALRSTPWPHVSGGPYGGSGGNSC